MPEGTVTFLFSDVEGSTRLLEAYGAAIHAALIRHQDIFRGRDRWQPWRDLRDGRRRRICRLLLRRPMPWSRPSRPTVRSRPRDGLRWAGGWRAGSPSTPAPVELRGGRYFGAPLFRCARLQALAYGEQTVVSAATAALANDALPDGARLIDRGVHRLKDLQEPEHVYELQHPDLRTEFPPLKSLDARRHNLPVQLSSFIGREEELADVGELVQEHRLVTLLGPGGMGKTRLALQAAADQIDAFPDGAWFVDLSAVADAERIAAEIGAALSVREDPEIAVQETLAAHLRSKNLLLVLDNLEQLLPLGARPVADLMAQAPELHVLATSRSRCASGASVEYDLSPLTAGDPEPTDDVLPDAVALFLARAREIRPDLVVDETTGPADRRDLQAARRAPAGDRARQRPPADLQPPGPARTPCATAPRADRRGRRPAAAAADAWRSHRLERGAPGHGRANPLSPPWRLRRRVQPGRCVSRGRSRRRCRGRTYDPARAFPGSAPGRPDEPRFTMLETIREFAVDGLSADGEEGVTRDRIADFTVRPGSRSPDDLLGQRQALTLRLMDAELPNIRGTLAWLQQRGDDRRLPTLVANLTRYWSMRGLRREGRRWIDAAVPLVTDQESNVRGRLYRAEALMTLDEGAPTGAKGALERAIAIHRARGDTRDLASCLLALSLVGNTLHDFDLTLAAATEAAGLAHEDGDLRTEGAALGNIGQAHLQGGRIDEGEAFFRKCESLLYEAGDLHGVVLAFDAYAQIARVRGDLREAARIYSECVAASVGLGDPEIEILERLNLAMVLSLLGEWQQAAPELLRALALGQELADLSETLTAVSIAGSLLLAAGDPSGAALVWAMSQVISDDRQIAINPLDRDDEAFARVRGELRETYAEIESRAATASLDEAAEEVASRLRALIDATPNA